MKKIKYIFIILLLLLLSTNLYENYIFYGIPYNPFEDFTTNTPVVFYFTKNYPDDEITKSSRDLNTTALILEYFCDLDLIPVKRYDIPENRENIYFSGMFTFNTSIQEHVHISEIFVDSLSYLRISSDRSRFKDGYYRIIDGEFDYKYIDDLISNSKK